MKKQVREVIIVEGRYDKNAVLQAVDATVFETSGFGIFKDRDKLRLFSALAAKRGLIVLTDSDSAGFLIRNRIKGLSPSENIKHAYIPDIPGKERRKRVQSKEGKLGVEGMSPEIILDALKRAGATFENSDAEKNHGEKVTKTDFYNLGLTGTPDSSKNRSIVISHLGLPALITTNGLIDAVNVLLPRKEFIEMCANLLKKTEL